MRSCGSMFGVGTVDRWEGRTTQIEDRAVRDALARARIDNEVSWLLAQRSAWIAATGGLPSIEGSMAKLFATQAFQRRHQHVPEPGRGRGTGP